MRSRQHFKSMNSIEIGGRYGGLNTAMSLIEIKYWLWERALFNCLRQSSSNERRSLTKYPIA